MYSTLALSFYRIWQAVNYSNIKIDLVETMQSHMILTMSHWSSGLTLCFPSQGTWVQIPWGDLCETGILLLSLSCYNLLKVFFLSKLQAHCLASFIYKILTLSDRHVSVLTSYFTDF
jgi:hypothetical protein